MHEYAIFRILMHNRVSAWSPLSFSEPGQGFRGEEGFRALCSGALRATPVSADALHRAESFGGLGHGGVSGRSGLGLGEGTLGCPESEREGKGLLAHSDLWPG